MYYICLVRAVKEVVYCLVINDYVSKDTGEIKQKITKTFLAAMRPGATPVPIPNTMVKARAADGTTLATVWESRWPPDQKRELWKGRAETALMHLENCIRRNRKLIDRDTNKEEQDRYREESKY